MKYRLVTRKNKNGNDVVVKDRFGEIDYYYIQEVDGDRKEVVSKQWILEHRDSFTNLGAGEKNICVASEKTSEQKIQDFGEKIGGAKKELWKQRGLQLDDITDFNDGERESYIKKDNIWIKPKYDALVEQGYDRLAVCYIKFLRDSIPTTPHYISSSPDRIMEMQEWYIDFVSSFRDYVQNNVRCADDIDRIGIKTLVNFGMVSVSNGYGGRLSYTYTERGQVCLGKLWSMVQESKASVASKAYKKGMISKNEFTIYSMNIIDTRESSVTVSESSKTGWDFCVKIDHSTYFYFPYKNEKENPAEYYAQNPIALVYLNKVMGAYPTVQDAQNYIDRLRNHMKNEDSEDSKSQQQTKKQPTDRKKPLIPKQLEKIERTGPTVRNKPIEGNDFISVFGIKGGEFGNWVNENERQVSMNMAFDAFKDMAYILGVSDNSIGLRGRLSIAFGARGSGNALAHYEPLREVINLTKMKGAGSLAHEYFHAIDNISSKLDGRPTISFMTSNRQSTKAFENLVDTMKYKNVKQQIVIDKNVLQERKNNIIAGCDSFLAEINGIVPLTDENRKELRSCLVNLARPIQGGKRLIYFHDNLSMEPTDIFQPVLKQVEEIKGKKLKKGEIVSILRKANIYQQVVLRNLLKEESREIEERVETDYYKNSKKIDSSYSKQTYGYWSSEIEMAARAFACYIRDKLNEKGRKNDYLCGHSEMWTDDLIPTMPEGKERKAINKAFDALIEELKAEGLFKS